jgi:hypothetical protein
MTDLHKAIGPDGLQEPAAKRHDVEGGGAWACTAHCPLGERDRAVREADETLVGDGNPEDRGGEGGAGGVSVVLSLPGDVPGDGPALGGDGLQQSGVAQVFCAERPGDGGERFDRDKAVGAGGAPCRAVL